MSRSAFLLLALLLVAGCDTERYPAAGPGTGEATMQAEGELVAGWLASALADDQVRSQMLQALRETPFSEHAIPLAALVAGPDGEWFVGALANASGLTERAVRDHLAALPPLDLYMPVRAHRESWRGGLPLIVAAWVDTALPRGGYLPNGEKVPLDFAQAPSETPLLLLQFAEHKTYRVDPRPTGAGMGIQNPAESDYSAAYIDRPTEGREIAVQVRDLPSEPSGAKYCPPDLPGCPPPPPPGGGGDDGDPPGPQPGDGWTKLTRLTTNGECDLTDCSQGNEIELRAYSAVGSNVLRIEGVPSTTDLQGLNYTIVNYSPSTLVPIRVGVWETDWPSSDDHFVYLHSSGAVLDPVLQVAPTVTNNVYWRLWRSPYINPATDPFKVAVTLSWTDF